jgi:Zn-dependent metalloprotease
MNRLTERQGLLLGSLRQRDAELVVHWDDVRGIAADTRGKLGGAEAGDDARMVLGSVEEWLELFGVADAERELRPLHVQTDELGWRHYEFQQVATRPKGLDVYGAKLAVRVNGEGLVYNVQSSCWPNARASDKPQITVNDVRDRLAARLEGVPGHLGRSEDKDRDDFYPLAQEPALVVLPWQGGFRLAWVGFAYGGFDPVTREPEGEGVKSLELGQFFADAITGDLLLFAPRGMDAETPDTGTGSAVTPLGAPTTRSLHVVRLNGGNTYLLRDTTQAREIVTYDAANSASWDTDLERGQALGNGTLPVSADTDGDKNWSRLPADTTVAERTASQQPETDLHFFMRDINEWYQALGRTGWDNGQFADPPVPNQTLRALAHVSNGGSATSINAGMRSTLINGGWLFWLQFFDGDATTYDYLAGSKWLVAHEYQHAVTDFTFRDGFGNPGLTYSDWLAAVHEGMSDVAGGLYSEQWLPATEISPNGQIWRNLVFPRDDGPPPASAAFDSNKFDHFDDATPVSGTQQRYKRGTVLAHCAYLTGRGGVHQRATRTPALIPVVGLGAEVVSGRNVLRAARIWNRAMNVYVSTIGSSTGSPTNDSGVFRTIRNACVNAAIDLYGSGSREHLTTVLAWYAVGLHPSGASYGADPTFLTWGVDWQLSQPYVGLNSPLWSSLDLFINNGGASEWNAVVNVVDGAGNPTQFENNVFCRVRNVGDQAATNVTVQFFYAKIGTNPTGWQPMLDRNGVAQVLTVGSLAAGTSTFTDAQQSTPPTSARVKWWVPPLAAGETVNHYCMRAALTADNDVNGQNNQVQSNVHYSAYIAGAVGATNLTIGNIDREPLRPEVEVATALPAGWKATVEGDLKTPLEPGEERILRLLVAMPDGADRRIEAPYDGAVIGELSGQLTGPVTGILTGTLRRDDQLEGTLALVLGELGTFTGGFRGSLAENGALVGVVSGPFSWGKGEGDRGIVAKFEGWLRPWRRIDISQLVDGRPIGGVTVQVQVPPLGDQPPLPPTDVFIAPGFA